MALIFVAVERKSNVDAMAPEPESPFSVQALFRLSLSVRVNMI